MLYPFNFVKPFPHSFTRFAIKAGIAATAVYYIKEQGVWKQSDESIKAYEKIKEVACPYVKELTSQIPYELPKLPESDVASSIVKESWNKGVLVTFKFLSDLPDSTRELTAKGIDAIKQNEEVKKLLNSSS
ncbi:MICOS complex subunit MIC13 homolog QIL1 isoform X1 [Diabrotica undecimpunctata]|uniref:MICOS complex subunit MIC13 homolog QIL1 isoform X1 n=1 Tax=Diabrotica undecimpunctata TaxID=50387 RepID=UPI003B64092F